MIIKDPVGYNRSGIKINMDPSMRLFLTSGFQEEY